MFAAYKLKIIDEEPTLALMKCQVYRSVVGNFRQWHGKIIIDSYTYGILSPAARERAAAGERASGHGQYALISDRATVSDTHGATSAEVTRLTSEIDT